MDARFTRSLSRAICRFSFPNDHPTRNPPAAVGTYCTQVKIFVVTTETGQGTYLYEGTDEVTIIQPYTGIGIEVDDGTFGIYARDGGIEVVMPDGRWISLRKDAEPFVFPQGENPPKSETGQALPTQ